MTVERNPDIGYLSGVITDNDVVVVVAGSAELEEEDIEHSFLGFWKQNKWAIFEEDFYIISLAAGRRAQARIVLSLGISGEVIVNEPGGVIHEVVAKGRDAPSRLRTMYQARSIGENFYAVGMRRQVFRRPVKGAGWQRIDAGVLVPNSSKDIAGFMSVDGLDEREIYAVGLGGEIWLFDGAAWTACPTPTNLSLMSVVCREDGSVVACGDTGLVLHGRKNAWRDLGQQVTKERLQSAAALAGKVYFATDSGILIEWDGANFQPITPFEDREITTGFLHSNGRKLLSIGEEDILLFDGATWTSVPHPPIQP